MLENYKPVKLRIVVKELIKEGIIKHYKKSFRLIPWLIIAFLLFSSYKPIETKVPLVKPNYKEYMLDADILDKRDINSVYTNYLNTNKLPTSTWDLFRLKMYILAEELDSIYNFPLKPIELYDYMMKTTFAESKFDGSAKNSKSTAKGGWQYMKNTREQLDIPHNVDKIPLHEQVKYKKKYFMYKMKSQKIDPSKVDEFVDVYCIIFSPGNADEPSSKLLFRTCSRSKRRCKKKGNSKWLCAYHANNGYDVNKDGNIKKKEIGDYILNKHYKK